jgi:hypothetical protein
LQEFAVGARSLLSQILAQGFAESVHHFSAMCGCLFLSATLAKLDKLFVTTFARSWVVFTFEISAADFQTPGSFSPMGGQILRGLGVSVCLTPSCDKCWKVGLRISSLRKFGRMRSHWNLATALVVVCQDS